MKGLSKTDKAYISGLLAGSIEDEVEKIRKLRDVYIERFKRNKLGFKDVLSGKIQAYDEILLILGYHESQYPKE